MKKLPVKDFMYTSGGWKGRLKQGLLQVPGEDYTWGDEHPFVVDVVFRSPRTDIRGNTHDKQGRLLTKDDPRYVEKKAIVNQRWYTKSDYEKDFADRKEAQRKESGYYDEDRTTVREAKLDQAALQVPGRTFERWEEHPTAKGVIYYGERLDTNTNQQRWKKGTASDKPAVTLAHELRKKLQTGEPIGTFTRGDPHPDSKDLDNPEYVFVQYSTKDSRWSTEGQEVNGTVYIKINPEYWLHVTDNSAPSVVPPAERERQRVAKEMNIKLQTGDPHGTYTRGQEHPEDPMWVYNGMYEGKQRWVHRTSKTAKAVMPKKTRLIIPQSSLQVPGFIPVKGKLIAHPEHPDLFYYSSSNGKQKWYPIERINAYKAKHRECTSTPAYLKRKAISDRAYRQQPENILRFSILRADRRHTDLQYRARKSLDARLQRWLLGGSERTRQEAEYYLGTKLEKAVYDFEQQFFTCPRFGTVMSWDTYGKYPGLSNRDYNRGFKSWHIDHVIPCADFDLENEDDRLACYNINNLRPLWGWMNMSKGAKHNYEIPSI